MSTGCWRELPLDLLSLIFNKVMSFSLSDYVRISAVCFEWRSFFITENYEHIKFPNKLPVLLLPSFHPPHPIEEMNNLQQQQQQQNQEEEEEEEGEGDFLNDRHDYYNPREIWLGLNHKQRHRNTRSFYSILEKKAWTRLTGLNYGSGGILNLICYRGQFWKIFQNGRAVAFDISPLLPKPNVTTIIDPPQDDDDPSSMSRYLVESAGNLFQVRRDIISLGDNDDEEDSRYSTGGFHVFKLDRALMEWVKTNSLDGHMFFLGDNASISLSASDYYFSGGGGSCKPNSIYFTDDYTMGYGSRLGADGSHDMGVFNLDDGSFERFEPYYTVDSRNIMPASIWIQPML